MAEEIASLPAQAVQALPEMIPAAAAPQAALQGTESGSSSQTLSASSKIEEQKKLEQKIALLAQEFLKENYKTNSNKKPEIEFIPGRLAGIGKTTEFLVKAKDAGNGKLSLFVKELPEGAKFTDNGNGTGLFSWSPEKEFGKKKIVFYATDLKSVSKKEMRISFAKTKGKKFGQDAPAEAHDQEVTGIEDQELEFDLDIEGFENLQFCAIAQPSALHGTVSFEITGNMCKAAYVPNPNYFGDDSFGYEVDDGTQSDTATVAVHLLPINDPPILIVIDNAQVNEGDTLAIDVNAADADNDTLTMWMEPDMKGARFINIENGKARFAWQPSYNQSGFYDVYFYATDGIETTRTTVEVTVNEVKDIPAEANNQLINVPKNTSTSFWLDLEGFNENVDCGATMFPEHGTIEFTEPNEKCFATYTPDEDFTGTDLFEYRAEDDTYFDYARVLVTVGEIMLPEANDQNEQMTEDTTAEFHLDMENFSSNVECNIDVPPRNGMATIKKDPADQTKCVIDYEPGQDFFGADRIIYWATDSPYFFEATVDINVINVNDAPYAYEDMALAQKNTAIDINVLANDWDPDGDALSVVNVYNIKHGTAAINADNTIAFTPETDYCGMNSEPGSFNYAISDGHGEGDGIDAIVEINCPPVLAAIADQSIIEGSALTFSISATDSDGNTLNFSASNLPSWATLTDNGNGTATITGTAATAGTTTTTFTAADENNGTDSEEITITVNSSGGGGGETPPSGGSSGGGGGGGGLRPCTADDVAYGEWGSCTDGKQSRNYSLQRRCTGNPPLEELERSCETEKETETNPTEETASLSCDDSNPCTADSVENGECVFNAATANGKACYTKGVKGTCQNSTCIESSALEKAPEAQQPASPLTALAGLVSGNAIPLAGIFILVLIVGAGTALYFKSKNKPKPEASEGSAIADALESPAEESKPKQRKRKK